MSNLGDPIVKYFDIDGNEIDSSDSSDSNVNLIMYSYPNEIQNQNQTMKPFSAPVSSIQKFMPETPVFLPRKVLGEEKEEKEEENSKSRNTVIVIPGQVLNTPIPGKSLKSNLNCLLNLDSKQEVFKMQTAPYTTSLLEQTVFTSTQNENVQIIQTFITSVNTYASGIPATTSNTTNPNYPTIQFIVYDENNQPLGTVATFPFRSNGLSPYALTFIFATQNEPYIFLKKGQSLRIRLLPLTGNTAIFQNIVLDVTLNLKIFDDNLNFKTFYKLLSPSDVNRGTPQFLYQNTTTDKLGIVVTGNQVGSLDLEPYLCPQQTTPLLLTTFSVYVSFDFDGMNQTSFSSFGKTAAVTNQEGFCPLAFDSRSVNSGNPYQSYRLVPGEGIAIAYDGNITSDASNIPVLFFIVILEI